MNNDLTSLSVFVTQLIVGLNESFEHAAGNLNLQPDVAWLVLSALVLFVFLLVFSFKKTPAPIVIEETVASPVEPVVEELDVQITEPKLVVEKASEETLGDRLVKTRAGLFEKLKSVFSSKPRLDNEMLEELEYLLISADLGVKTVSGLMNDLKEKVSKGDEITEESLISKLRARVSEILGEDNNKIFEGIKIGSVSDPMIIMVVGVNGAGKTTTCAKLAGQLKERGLKVLLVAADTFRAAAVQQLKTWGERLDIPVLAGAENAKPQSVVFDAMTEAKNGNYDVVLIDTAGRLHTKSNLMQELEGIKNTVMRHYPNEPRETLLVIDGSTGQNALSQAKEFNESTKLSGLIVTKLDGTPKGGIVVAIKEELGIPVRYIGVGESHLDLRPFQSSEFIDAIFNRSNSDVEQKVSAHGETRRRRRRRGEEESEVVNS